MLDMDDDQHSPSLGHQARASIDYLALRLLSRSEHPGMMDTQADAWMSHGNIKVGMVNMDLLTNFCLLLLHLQLLFFLNPIS
jgi:hypothetical protein